VDVDDVRRELSRAGVDVSDVPCAADVSEAEVPAEVARAFGPQRPIPPATWSALSALDRYVLRKVAVKARPERLQLAYSEIVGQSAVSNHLEPRGGARMVNVS